MDIDIVTDPAAMDLDLVFRWLSEDAYWSLGRTRDVFDRSIRESLCFGALDPGGQLGFARIVTDRATFAWLCDVFVSPAARGRGIGRRLLDAVAAHPDLQTVRRILLATRDAHGLYARHGFQPLAEPARWMERYGER
jgi:GNAT superfamily N-acetyltransferase